MNEKKAPKAVKETEVAEKVETAETVEAPQVTVKVEENAKAPDGKQRIRIRLKPSTTRSSTNQLSKSLRLLCAQVRQLLDQFHFLLKRLFIRLLRAHTSSKRS